MRGFRASTRWMSAFGCCAIAGYTLGLAILVAAVGPASSGAHAQEPPDPAAICHDESAEPELRLSGCSRVVEEIARPVAERVEALITRGALNEDAENLDAALADLSEALKLAPADPTALLLRGNVYYARNELDRALADYDAGIKAEPNDPAGYFNRGIVLEAKGEREKAIADYRKALELDPDFAEAKSALKELEVN